MRCSPSIVPPELGPANAGPLCVLASPIGSIPEDTGPIPTKWLGRVGDYGGCSMKRREFITLLGGAAAARPFAARAQQTPGLPIIGTSRPMTASVENQRVVAFAQRLRELGWLEGRTVAIKVRWGERRSERTAEIVAEFVGEKVDVTVAAGAASVLAAEQGDFGRSDCPRGGGRPPQHWLCREAGATGWRCRGLIVPAERSCWQTFRTFARGGPCASPVSDFGQCRQSCHPAGYAPGRGGGRPARPHGGHGGNSAYGGCRFRFRGALRLAPDSRPT